VWTIALILKSRDCGAHGARSAQLADSGITSFMSFALIPSGADPRFALRT